LTSNNVVVADALGAMIIGIPLKKARHILIAEREGIGTTNLEDVRINVDWRLYRRQFQIKKTLIDRASSLLFNSDIIAKLVMDSFLTPLAYAIASVLRSPEEKAIANHLRTKNNIT